MSPTEMKRAERKGAARARRLFGSDTAIYGYIPSRAHPRVTAGAIALVAAFDVAFVAAVTQGAVLIPGLLLVVVVHGLVSPPRPVAVTNRGVALLEASTITGHSTRVITEVAHAAVGDIDGIERGSKVELTVGSTVVWCRQNDFDRLARAIHAASGA